MIAPLFVMKPLAENVSKKVPHMVFDARSRFRFVDLSAVQKKPLASFIKQEGQSGRDTGWMCGEDTTLDTLFKNHTSLYQTIKAL